MILIDFSLYFLLIFVSGHLITSLMIGRKASGFIETTALSLTLGLGFIPLALYWLSLVGIPSIRSALIAIGVLCLSLQILIRYGRRSIPNINPHDLPARQSHRPIAKAIRLTAVLLLLGGFITVVIVSLFLPLYEWDSFAIWGLKAKVIYSEAILKTGYFHDLNLSYSHLNYPLLVPFLSSCSYAIHGAMFEAGAKLYLPIVYLALMLMIYVALRWKLSADRALVLTSLYANLPVLVRWAGSGNADVPLLLFHTAGLFYLIKWAAEHQQRDVSLSACFAFFCVFTKNEGLLLAVFYLFTILLVSVSSWRGVIVKQGVLAITIFTLMASTWLGFRNNLPHTDEDYFSRLSLTLVVNQLDRLPFILTKLHKTIANIKLWGGLWIALPLAGIMGFRALKHDYIRFLYAFLIGHLLSYILIYIISPWKPEDLISISMNRLLLHVLPAPFMLIAYHYSLFQTAHQQADYLRTEKV